MALSEKELLTRAEKDLRVLARVRSAQREDHGEKLSLIKLKAVHEAEIIEKDLDRMRQAKELARKKLREKTESLASQGRPEKRDNNITFIRQEPEPAPVETKLEKEKGKAESAAALEMVGAKTLPESEREPKAEPKPTEAALEVEDHVEPELGASPQAEDVSPDAQEIFEGDPFEDETWIKLYRKFRKNPIYKDSVSVHLFVHLLLAANHKPNRFIFNEKEIAVKRGQLVTGRKKISAETGISESTVKRRLKLFEKLGILTIKPTNKFSILTLCNYNHYQESNFEKRPAIRTTVDGSQRTIKRPSTDHQLTTNKKYKNVRSKNTYVEGSTELRLASLFLEEIRKNKGDFKGPADLQTWARVFDLMLRRDHRKPEQVEKVIRWVQSDHGDGTGKWKGWAPNVLSPGKLKEKFDQLELKMQESRPQPKERERGPKYEKVN